VQIEALQQRVQSQQKALENLQMEVTRLCAAERSLCAENPE
jgi:cell division protein FtsL